MRDYVVRLSDEEAEELLNPVPAQEAGETGEWLAAILKGVSKQIADQWEQRHRSEAIAAAKKGITDDGS